MELYNGAELSTSGIAYTIQDADIGFADTGELEGYTEITDDRYWAGMGMEGTFEPLCDCTELTDDYPILVEYEGYDNHAGYWEEEVWMDGRWAHVKDSHTAETLEREILSRPCQEDFGLDFGAMQFWALHRERRVTNLVTCMRRLAWWAKRARNWQTKAKIRKLAKDLRDGTTQRYIESIKLIMSRGKDEWYLMYLKKEQHAYLQRCTKRLISYC